MVQFTELLNDGREPAPLDEPDKPERMSVVCPAHDEPVKMLSALCVFAASEVFPFSCA